MVTNGKNSLRLEWRDAKELKDNPLNWRKHPSSQSRALADLIGEVGWAGALLYNEQTGRLIDGHLRKKIVKGKVPVLVGSWNEADEKKILATLDPVANMAQADSDALINLLCQVETGSQAVKDLLEALANGENLPLLAPKEGLIDDDEVPEVKEAICKTGELWILGDHRLLCGDATKKEDVERLMGGQKAVLLATDPPYGDLWVQKAKDMHAHGYGHSRAERHGSIASDDKNPAELRIFLDAFFACAKVAGDAPFPAYVWHHAKRMLYEQAFLDAGYLVHQPIVWVKPSFVIGRMHYHPRCEWALYGWLHGGGECPFYGERNQSDVWEIARQNDGLHPTQKPTTLFEIPIMNHTRQGEICYEPFAGSGTQFIAAEKHGRKCYGLEIEPHYCDVIIERWQKFTGR